MNIDLCSTLSQVGQQVEGIGKALQIEGVGHVRWTFKADDGSHRTLRLPAYYVPGFCHLTANRPCEAGC